MITLKKNNALRSVPKKGLASRTGRRKGLEEEEEKEEEEEEE
jgi:hypothetical protein